MVAQYLWSLQRHPLIYAFRYAADTMTNGGDEEIWLKNSDPYFDLVLVI